MIDFEEFKKMEIRIAEVTSVEEHPDAEKLLVLKVDLGGDERQIVAGIKGHYQPEELIGKRIVLLANLEPATIRGVESKGMLLAAQDGDTISILAPDPGRPVSPGSPVR